MATDSSVVPDPEVEQSNVFDGAFETVDDEDTTRVVRKADSENRRRSRAARQRQEGSGRREAVRLRCEGKAL
jgi:hypothetical protein